jgi:hypothetical protein
VRTWLATRREHDVKAKDLEALRDWLAARRRGDMLAHRGGDGGLGRQHRLDDKIVDVAPQLRRLLLAPQLDQPTLEGGERPFRALPVGAVTRDANTSRDARVLSRLMAGRGGEGRPRALPSAASPTRRAASAPLARVLDKLIGELVERVVGQVAAALPEIGEIVSLGGEAREAVLKPAPRAARGVRDARGSA